MEQGTISLGRKGLGFTAAFLGDLALDEEGLWMFQVNGIMDVVCHTIFRVAANASGAVPIWAAGEWVLGPTRSAE
ncbi:hypothetical protein Y1Q_0002499 [Alligator mississippiensis]|uniref:Uncharacterized protein n=1 Tax=Alligator mississippiensis TaxID=8496 RepID=A0A151NBK2_ALLMI|nr:hypothetical protein Y1Q_0002499 [Alligator mississippiensis]